MCLFRLSLGLKCVLAAALLLPAATGGPARADGFFGLFGGEAPPLAPRAGALTYQVEFHPLDDSLTDPLKDVANSWRLRQEPVDNGESLARRVAADLPRMVDALWAEGYYDATVTAEVEGRPIALDGAGVEAAASAANRAMGLQIARVVFEVAPGPQYKIGDILIVDARTGAPLDDPGLSPSRLKLETGDPARASAVRALQTRVVNVLRSEARALARIEKAEAIVRHATQRVDIEVRVVPGPKVGFGAVAVKHDGGIDPEVIRSFIYIEEGDPFSPERIAAMRRSIGQIEAIGSTRILESDHLDADGNLPLTVETSERKAHAVSLAAQYSTVDGPSVRGDWTFRNLFGDGERLRLSAVAGVTPDNGGENNVRLLDPQHLVGRFNASFIKPALYGSHFDYLADFTLAREVTKSYSAEYLNTTQALRYRFNETLSVTGGVEVERGGSSDPFGNTNYLLVGLTAGVHYDTTDSLLDPRSGVRVLASGGAYPTFLGSSLDFYQGKAQVSTYYALDDDQDYVLAGRIGLGASGGAGILNVPDNRRFFAGGGGSVRGYAWRSLSPMGYVPGQGEVAMGGASLFEASVEGRIKVTDDIGVVPFIDAGSAFSTALPNFVGGVRFAGGLGLRYYTGFGPIRLDVAAPINPQPGDPTVAVYVGIGQAF
ncbi:translocation and assembly module TamA [Rhodoblastus acidophilus]|uniref:autotransporter assembly complex protein TamA n=1 Tax=Rhodoblastus acidophilus TaxID=1074 RepID=UPI0022252FA8|nr:BamA/TamA family outer membrane protein [Rhodoblastus acidophilus]MCW2286215.1 translocation and assembly module TamA [Rhodoblastus acidophilus]MCW2335103.1 translocation and assembly module TamA [Rhodoblastus acidophilus]